MSRPTSTRGPAAGGRVVSTVAVFGASGRQGQAQVRRLLSEGHRVRAVSRTAGIFDAPEFAGVEVVAADYADPSSLDRALDGVDAVFAQPPQAVAPEQTLAYAANLAAAAERASVRRYVHNTTMWAPDEPCGQVLYDLMLMVENIVAGHDLSLVIFRPTVFMDNWLADFARPVLIAEHTYRYPHPAGFEMTPISLDDVAKFMIAALDRDDLVGRRIRIAGPEMVTPPQVAEFLSAAMGVPIVHEYQTPLDFGRYVYRLLSGDQDVDQETYAGFIADFYTYNVEAPTRPFHFDVAPVLAEIPVALETFGDWALRQDWYATAAVGSGSG